MAQTVAQLIADLQTDPWREEVGYSPDLADTQEQLFASTTDEEAKRICAAWLERCQPCHFGRIASKLDMLSYCFLRDSDLLGDERRLRDKIQQARLDWTREAYHGRKTGFLILTISPTLCKALPNDTAMQLAQRLSSLHLLRSVEADKLYTDHVYLENPADKRTTWHWEAAVSCFWAQGDRRWWHDHRVPGGLGFSVTSAGHMCKTGALLKQALAAGAAGGALPESQQMVVHSLAKGLEMSMRSVHFATRTRWGKATRLLPLPETSPPCPEKLPAHLQEYDYRYFEADYHPDCAVPSPFFRPDVGLPAGHQPMMLDFTYFFDDRIDNHEYVTQGAGRLVRASATERLAERLRRFPATIRPLDECALLTESLAERTGTR